MSTKNLARTVIEGGRASYNQFERWHSNAVERARAHLLERDLMRSANWEDTAFLPRKPVSPSFSDKLGPAQRWLHSQVGRPWNKVRSELFERFDSRTTAGRHILFCHLLEDVDVEARYSPDHCRYHVSPHGILQYRGRRRFAGWQQRPRLPEPDSVLRAWLGARRVIAHGTRLFWLLATPHGGFRQHHELSAADAAHFKALPDWFREELVGTPPPPVSGSWS
jgi:hypothetical protein